MVLTWGGGLHEVALTHIRIVSGTHHYTSLLSSPLSGYDSIICNSKRCPRFRELSRNTNRSHEIPRAEQKSNPRSEVHHEPT